MTDDPHREALDKQREVWAKSAPRYDRQMQVWERRLFGDSRSWACSRATGDVLEVAIGTGLNLPHYPADVSLTGLDLSPAMLRLARARAHDLGRDVVLTEGDAHHLPYDDAAFDTVVATFSLCNIPDPRQAIDEMRRVLKPGGQLVLVDHVASTNRVVLLLQRLVEKLSIRLAGEHFTRRPLPLVTGAGFTVEDHVRHGMGMVERLTARKAA